MHSNKELILSLKHVITPRVAEAFIAVDRKDFVPEDELEHAYADRALPIGHGQTISQPSTVAFMLALLDPQPGDTILDVGSGSGWTTALLAHLVGPSGRVYGVERIKALADIAQIELEDIPQADVRVPNELGLPEHAPYDRILVSAAANELPDELVLQLKIGGKMIIPVQHSILAVTRVAENEVEQQEYPGFAFVPLL